ncbi:ComEC family competence protein [Acuticoccus sp. M5D2P5]|uniref:ComEC/Rec2 family competence protein n=1 Tax=Acuticoccus kalidii TaxID=2910977 RepID=UPI001F390A76|nr:ComEC/Rec2 family competence protein [Acuticoccus kalidii]MCF3935641.1 ComEC family competence protein [Acuticoccus kalidii]
MSLVLTPADGRFAVATWLGRMIAHDVDFGRTGLWTPVFVAAGIGLAVAAPFDPSPLRLGEALAALLVVRWGAARSDRFAAFTGPLFALAMVVLGALLLALQAEYRATPVLAADETLTITGRVLAAESRGEGRQSLVIGDLEGDFDGPVPHAVRIAMRGGDTFAVGDAVSGLVGLFPLAGPVYPGGYDAARRLYFDRIGATGFSYGPLRPTGAPPRDGPIRAIDRLRSGIETGIAAVLPPREAAFAAALLVGRRGAMEERDVEALRRSGLGHILAISGLHMALVAGTVFALVRRGLALVPPIALRYPIRKWAAVVGLLAATFYLAISGGSVATMRAYIMLAVALVAILADRPALTMRTIAVAAIVVMLIDPVSVVEPGFQMSFLAVVALVGAYEWWAGRPRLTVRGWARPLVLFPAGLAATSMIAGLATAAPSAYHFHQLAPLGLLANLAAMPILTILAMPAGVLALLAWPVGLAELPLMAMGTGLTAILALAHTVSDWTGSAGAVGAIPALSFALVAAGILWLAIFLAPWRLLGIGAILAGLALAPTAPRYDILVADDGETVAARGEDGRLTILGRPAGFAAESWRRADGAPALPAADAPAPRCDALGCTLGLAEGLLAVPRSPRALAEDCASAEAVVSRGIVRTCTAPLRIDRRDLIAHGSIGARRVDGLWRRDTARPNGRVRHWHVAPTVERD